MMKIVLTRYLLPLALVVVATPVSLAGEVRGCQAQQNSQSSIVLAQSDSKWCCCGGCCGYAVNCSAIPGCLSC